jgi:dolichol-phosphate mannosyltransferase
LAPAVSVVVPTYNEARNIRPLLAALDEAFAGVDAEYVVVDDDSKDGTAQQAMGHPRTRVVVRKGERGLATAVARGLREATGTYVAVMDADFQHPPASVRALYDRAVATDAHLVVGSRYAAGGSEGKFSWARRQISHGAAGLARLALPPVRQHGITDPMSGLFLVRRDRLAGVDLRPQGYKILLELLARVPFGRVEEVGYRFATRREGASKLGAKVLLQYVLHLAWLALWHPENQRAVRFMAVGLSGAVVGFGVLALLHEALGWDVVAATIVATEAGIINNFLLNDALTFRDRRTSARWHVRFALFHGVSLAGLAVNTSVVFVLAKLVGVHYLLSYAVAVLAAFGVNYLGNLRVTYGRDRPGRTELPKASTWVPVLVLALASGGMYLANLDGIQDIYFDEHYYISVAHQLDNGILEDPCHAGGRMDGAPLNYEHPPLAKLILWASVHAYDSYHGSFTGCRGPDDTNSLGEPCQVRAGDEVLAEAHTRKECYDAFTRGLREQGNPYAWRAPSAIMGALTVVFAALAARRIFRSDLAGGLAGSFVLLDNLILSSSRIALLDIFATGFAVIAIFFATFPSRRGILLTTLFLGLGFSCKYYVLFVGPPTLLLSLWCHWRAGLLRRRAFDRHMLAYPLVPLAVWLATYTPWWVVWTRTRGLLGAAAHWLKVQAAAIHWDALGGDQNHQYQSKPWEWLPMTKPMSYIGPANPTEETVAGYIYAIGNPLLWWAAATAILYTFIDMVGDAIVSWNRTGMSPLRHFGAMPRIRQAMAVAALFPITAYCAFFALQRTTFLFYMTLVVPLFAIVLAGALAYAWSRGRAGRALVVVLCAGIGAAFLWYLPLSLYIPIPRDGFSWTSYPYDLDLLGLRLQGEFRYPAPGFHTILRLVPWMREYGSWDCWSAQDVEPGAYCP